jgi:outer membrane lipoprotein SlyB
LECCGKRELKSGEACCAGKYPYNTSKKCCYNKLLYIRRYTSDQCEANRIKCIRHVIDTLGAFAGSQSIGPAALGTVVTGVGGYVLGGMASSAWGGPVGFAVGAGAGAVVGIITIGADMAAIDAARKECKDSYDRCIECQKN